MQQLPPPSARPTMVVPGPVMVKEPLVWIPEALPIDDLMAGAGLPSCAFLQLRMTAFKQKLADATQQLKATTNFKSMQGCVQPGTVGGLTVLLS